jgi:hypothetical protein
MVTVDRIVARGGRCVDQFPGGRVRSSGLVGFKPTYGLASTRGMIPGAWSMDHVGPSGDARVSRAELRDLSRLFHDDETDARDSAAVTDPRPGESIILAVARVYEQALNWHQGAPAV